MKLQQFSGPVMAEGRRGHRLLSLQSVRRAERSRRRAGAIRPRPVLFHKANAARARALAACDAGDGDPRHQARRGQSSARLAVLSEMPEEWRAAGRGLEPPLARETRRCRRPCARPIATTNTCSIRCSSAPGRSTCSRSPSAEQLKAYGARIQAALEKSLREAKRRSSWAAPNAEYEEAMQAFAREALRSEGGFLSSFLPFVQRVARLGVENSLAQTVGEADGARACPTSIRAASCGILVLSTPTIAGRRLSRAARPRWRNSRAVSRSRSSGRAVRNADARMARRPSEAGDDRAAARSPPRGAGAFQRRRLSADRHRRRRSDWAFGYVRAARRATASRPDRALSRASGGGAEVERGGAICRRARGSISFRGALCRRLPLPCEMAASACRSRCC